ncbi:MAG TPA: hypothetical protein VH092_03455 [Urbifossiella sp.]|nr:hypothetical protein [Urbifossiella sp.]
MIRVARAEEPAAFEERVRTPGLRAIAEMVGEKPKRPSGLRHKKVASRREDIPAALFPSYWTEVLGDLMTAYNRICAYSCFAIHPVTGAASADHFVAKARTWDKVYEWDNYRLACNRLNARKKDFTGLLDPFEIPDGWFQLELVGFQVIPNPALDGPTRSRVRHTIDTLKLDDFRRGREADAENYWAKDVSLKILTQESPFVAKELRRQGRLNKGDQ